jgi:(4S)-4-hydroxy-5-phosphonooxypentane-2,3-dione isomerase
MLTFLATMTVKAEREQEFIRLCHELTSATLANEAGCAAYGFYKLREPLRYAVFEAFKTEADEAAHMASEHFKAIGPSMIDCLDGSYERIYLDPLPALKN